MLMARREWKQPSKSKYLLIERDHMLTPEIEEILMNIHPLSSETPEMDKSYNWGKSFWERRPKKGNMLWYTITCQRAFSIPS